MPSILKMKPEINPTRFKLQGSGHTFASQRKLPRSKDPRAIIFFDCFCYMCRHAHYRRVWQNAVLLLFFSCFAISLSAQSLKAYKKAATEALEKKDYQAGLHYYQQALQLSPEDMGLWYQYATLALQFNAFNEAERALLKVYESEEANRYPLTAYELGLAYKSKGEYDPAMAYFATYLRENPSGDKAGRVKKELEDCRWAKEDIGKESRWKVKHLGRRYNTDYSEFAPVQVGDTLYYSSFRYDKEEDDHDPQRKVSKLLYQRGRGRGRPITRGFNPDTVLTAHTAFSTNGQRIYFTRCRYINASEIQCKIVYKDKDRRKRWERECHYLSDTINPEGYTTTHPSVGFDSTAMAEILFFASDRPGGKGGLDLWMVYLYGDSTGAPQPLSNINTPQDDLTPFFHTPSQTLFFSSDGQKSYGGYDIYRAEYGEAPEHLPAPINTSYNDIYFSLNSDGQTGYLASNRPESRYLDEDLQACCNDLYRVSYESPAPPPEAAVPDTTDIPIAEEPPKVPTKDDPPTKLENFLPLALYFDNDEPDRRTRKTTTEKTYTETYRDYISRIREYEQAFAEPLEGERKAEALDAIDQFFEEDVEKGQAWLGRFSEILLTKLEEGETVEIFLKGYTSPRAKRAYNLALSKRRISSVRNYFDTYEGGVFRSYLESNQLIISERPFGEAEASSQVSDALEDLRNSIYHPDAARERRVEIVEIKRE